MNQVFKSATAPDNINRLVTKNQKAEDIASYILKAEKKSRKYLKNLSHHFNAEEDKDVCKRIWYFLKKSVPYKREPVESQSAKTIPRILSDAKRGKGNDCKHYSTFAVAILNDLGIDCFFRLVSFGNNTQPTHAFAVAKVNGKEIYIDPCLNYFNTETSYKYKWDIRPAK